jgi:Ca2+/Na+ antiporter
MAGFRLRGEDLFLRLPWPQSVSEQPSDTKPSFGLVAQTIFVFVAAIALPTAFLFDGQLRSLALAAVSVLLLVGFLMISYRHTRRRKSLHQHVAFLTVWFGGVALASRLARVASSHFSDPGPDLIELGVTLGALWLSLRLAYGGELTKALFGSD